MAHIIYSSLGEKMQSGPLPHKAGEFCGNVLRKDVMVDGNGNVTIVNMAVFSSLLLPTIARNAKFKIGKPAEDRVFSSQEYEKFGHAGLYLAEDFPLPEDAVGIDTDMFLEEVVSGERPPQKPVDLSKIRRKELY